MIFSDSYSQLARNGNPSLTARYLRGELLVSEPREPRTINPERMLKFHGARPPQPEKAWMWRSRSNCMVVVTGVSGSGKSTLVHDVIYRALAKSTQPQEEGGEEPRPNPCTRCIAARIENAALVQEVVMIDQSPIGRTPRSNPVTYIKAFDIIRGLFRRHQRTPKNAATPPVTSPSTFPAAAARSARAMAPSPSKCSSWPTWNWSAKSAKAPALSRASWNSS